MILRYVKSYLSPSISFKSRIRYYHSIPGVHLPLERTQDKVHRNIFHSLERNVTRYNLRSIELRPTIPHFLIELDLVYKRKLSYRLNENWTPRLSKESELLEPILYFMVSLTIAADDTVKYVRYKQIDKIWRKLISRPGADIQSSNPDKKISLDIPIHDINTFNLAVSCLTLVIKRTPYDLEEVSKWVNSLLSPNITASTNALTKLIDIPGFVLGDILMRTPLTEHELELQLDLWYLFIETIQEQYRSKSSLLKTIFNNLLYYTAYYNTRELPELLQFTITFDTTNEGPTPLSLDRNYINELLWTIPYNTLISTSIHGKSDINSVMKTQEIMSHLIENKHSLQGLMGIVLAVSAIDKQKARSLLIASRDKHLKRRHELSKNELITFNFVRLMVSETPEELVHTFNEMSSLNQNLSTLWLGFIKKLQEFELLTSGRSLQILRKLLETPENIVISKNIIIHLLEPIKSPRIFTKFVLDIANGPQGLLLLVKNVLLEKFMILLFAYQKYPVSKTVANVLIPNHVLSDVNQGLEVARLLYSHYIKRKTPKIIGLMLMGEAQVQPENIFQLYQRELLSRNLLPDESCILALIKAARKHPRGNPEGVIEWGELYAPQVAVHEFRTYVKGPNSTGLVVSDRVWRSYIRMLRRFEYVSELSEIIGWWEMVKFIPDYPTLITLLMGLPSDFAVRHVSHMEKIRNESVNVEWKGVTSWPWPGLAEFKEMVEVAEREKERK